MNAICRKPAKRIAPLTQTMREPSGIPGKKQSAPSAPIHTTFRRHGISDAAANLPSAFKTPIPNAAPQMKIMYGTRRRVRRRVSDVRAENAAPHCSATESPATARTEIAASMSRLIVITARARRRALFIRCASTSPLNTGTNAAVSAPSPKSLRIMFGIANASVNALCSMPAPMRRLWNISRTRPITRESAVIAPTIAVFFRMPFPPPLMSGFGA